MSGDKQNVLVGGPDALSGGTLPGRPGVAPGDGSCAARGQCGERRAGGDGAVDRTTPAVGQVGADVGEPAWCPCAATLSTRAAHPDAPVALVGPPEAVVGSGSASAGERCGTAPGDGYRALRSLGGHHGRRGVAWTAAARGVGGAALALA